MQTGVWISGEIDDPVANIGDWGNHMSTLFPDVRLKRFLEMRGADGGPWQDICALPYEQKLMVAH